MHDSVQFLLGFCVYWSRYVYGRRRDMRMDDVDDLIYQDGWLTSER